MKLIASAIAVALAALFVVVSAPAHSARPAPMDFEMAAPAARARAAGGKGVVSKPLRASHTFDVVGLRWRGRARPHVHLRAREAGGSWTRWREVPVGGDRRRGYTDPAWAGGAQFVQYRLSKPVAGLRLHFVRTLGTTAPRTATPARAKATGQPAIVPRSGWNAEQCKPRTTPDTGQVKVAFVHHTVTLNDYTAEESPAIVLGICRYHRNSNGWNDIGYNFLVDKYGTIFEGRAGGVDRPVVGAQAEGWNSQSTGIANLGDYSSVPQSSAALNAMARLIRWKLPLEGAPTSGTVRVTSAGGSTNRFPAGTTTTLNRISGHRDGNSTECPGGALYAQLPELRRMVGNQEPPPPPATTPPPAEAKSSTRVVLTPPATVKVPSAARIGGRLATDSGDPVAGQPVAIEQLEDGTWRPLAQATTDPAGVFEVSFAVTARTVLRGVFPGAPGYRHSTSRKATLNVQPGLVLKAPAARFKPNARVRLRGEVKPAKPRVTVILQRRAGKRWARIASARAGGARFGVTFRPRSRGRYRAFSSFAGDATNVAGRSAYAYFRVAR
jgi:hypothetical protein